MTDFKQIIGRGTRVREDYGKLFFTILDYTGTATQNFADPAFDGEPARITEEQANERGETEGETELPVLEAPEDGRRRQAETPTSRWSISKPSRRTCRSRGGSASARKYYLANGVTVRHHRRDGGTSWTRTGRSCARCPVHGRTPASR